MRVKWPRPVARLVAAAFLALLGSCGGGEAGGGGSSSGPVASVRITPDTRQIAVGQTTTLTAQALDSSGNAVAGKVFTFSSSRPSFVTVADSAANPVTVTGVADGVSTITATTDGKSGTATVTVSGLADIQLSGRVIDGETQTGLGGARVAFDNGTATTTAADGSYSFVAPTISGQETLHQVLTASLSGYVTTQLFANYSRSSTVVEPILLARQNAAPGTVSGVVRNARDNAGIPGIAVTIRRDQGFGTPPILPDATTNAQGGYSFANVPAGTYTVSAFEGTGTNAFRYCGKTAISVGPATPVNQDLVCSPQGADEIRIVLSWGTNPGDLDAHLTGPNAADAERFHIYYPPGKRGSITTAPFALLDRDDTDSVGPETITVKGPLNSGNYRFSVHDFTNRRSATSGALGSSGAKVQVYYPVASSTGVTGQTFFVPNQPGTLWTVFELTGPITSPTVTPRNEMGFVENDAEVL